MKYTSIAIIATTVLVGGLAKFEISARENLLRVQEYRGGCRDEKCLAMNGGTESDDGYTPPNHGAPDSQHGSGTR